MYLFWALFACPLPERLIPDNILGAFVYASALPASRIQAHFQVGSPYFAAVLADTPVAYYRLGEASGTTATDASGNRHDVQYTEQRSFESSLGSLVFYGSRWYSPVLGRFLQRRL